MSVHVISWVLRNSDAHLGDRLVLLVLADHAKEDGTGAWPAVETIAAQTRLSERQARRCLRNLEEAGEIRETGKSKKGTHIYEFPRFKEEEYRRKGGDNMTPSGGTYRAEGGDNMTPDPSLKQPSVELLAAAPRNGRPRDEIWDALTTMFGEATTRSEQTNRGRVVRSLKEAGATPAEMFARAKRWPRHYDAATLTENALERHWSTLDPARKPLRRR